RCAVICRYSPSDDSDCRDLVGEVNADTVCHESAHRDAGGVSATDGHLEIALQFAYQLAEELDIIRKVVVVKRPLSIAVLYQSFWKHNRESSRVCLGSKLTQVFDGSCVLPAAMQDQHQRAHPQLKAGGHVQHIRTRHTAHDN